LQAAAYTKSRVQPGIARTGVRGSGEKIYNIPMAAPQDNHWLESTVNELNNLLQVISESSRALEPICEASPEGTRYFAFLRNGLDRAKQATGQLVTRLGGQTAPPPAEPKPAPATAAPRRPPVAIENPDGTKELILIIDDEALIVALAKRMLTDAGYRVVTSPEPFQALEVFKQLKDQVDLVILDFTLPIMDGSEVFDELRKLRPDVAVMLSSGFAEQEKVRAMLTQGLRGFLPKPYTQEKLLLQVRSTLDAIRTVKSKAS
jgi:CheY-like chemotaxis protein